MAEQPRASLAVRPRGFVVVDEREQFITRMMSRADFRSAPRDCAVVVRCGALRVFMECPL